MEDLGLDIQKLIYKDLEKLAQRKGLKDPNFGETLLIQAGILPGGRKQQVTLYHKLVENNIDDVEPKLREALCVKLNLREGYPDSGNRERLSVLAAARGRMISRDGTNRQTENEARKGQEYLAILIRDEINLRAERNAWGELLEEESRDDPERTDQFTAIVEDSPSREVDERPRPQGIEDGHMESSSPVLQQLEMPSARPDANPLLVNAEISSIPLTLPVREALDAACASCAAIDRYFLTPYLFLALLDLPNSKVSWCLDQVRPELSGEWRRMLVAYQEERIEDQTSAKYEEFDWDDRDDVWLAKRLAWRDGRPTVDDLYLLLGILGNIRSGTRYVLEQYLGAEDYERLYQIAEALRGHRIQWPE